MRSEIEKIIVKAVHQCFGSSPTIEISRPEEKFGDYSTNIAMQLAPKLQKPPREIAQAIVDVIKADNDHNIAEATIAGAGFINIKLSDQAIAQAASQDLDKPLSNQVIVTEYSDPNPFKVLHAGHLYTSVVGDAISNLLEYAGATVHRVNFGGDVGLHVAKNMWSMLQTLGGENPEKLSDVPETERAEWMADNYIKGNNAYDQDESAKQAIVDLNKKIYAIHSNDDHDSNLAKIYWTCRQWSYDYFDNFYAQIGSKFEKYYPESQTAPIGLETVKKHLGSVYQKSNGAVIFDGDKYGLHTRVFINSEGLPTYEAKDVGLIMLKKSDYNFDKSVIITANEIDQYMKVVLKSIEQYQPELVKSTTHLTHGMVRLQGNEKMSSRKGNILSAIDVLRAAAEASQALHGKESSDTVLGAVKYAFLKHRMGGDIIYDPNESVSMEGNSGPYLQYAHARAKSILRKSTNKVADTLPADPVLTAEERSLLRKITEYPEVIEVATNELMPHHICTYLYELAQSFNRFYEGNQVIGGDRQELRLSLVKVYSNVLSSGLKLLGINAPEEM